MASKVALDSIRSLTFYDGEITKARRSSPIPQLKCIGKPCSLFQPDVVRCVSDGGRGLDVQWKCEADLPEQLRFGRVEVSCEGWSHPGDLMVLKGSCGLEYRLVRISSALNNDDAYLPGPLRRLMPKDTYEAIFMLVWGLVLLFILYSFLKSCLGSRIRTGTTNPGDPRTGPGGGWFGYGRRPGGGNGDAPPPYSPHYKPSSSRVEAGWQPGFWSGLGLGGVAAALWNSQRRNNTPPVVPQRSMWDWERPTIRDWWGSTPAQRAAPATASGGWFGGGDTGSTRTTWSNQDRGEGTSNLGRMRSSTGYGGSTVR